MTAFKVFLSCKMPRSHKVSLRIWHIKMMNRRENKIKFCFADQEKYPGIHYGVCYETELWAVCASTPWCAKKGIWVCLDTASTQTCNLQFWESALPQFTSVCHTNISVFKCARMCKRWGSMALKIVLPHHVRWYPNEVGQILLSMFLKVTVILLLENILLMFWFLCHWKILQSRWLQEVHNSTVRQNSLVTMEVSCICAVQYSNH